MGVSRIYANHWHADLLQFMPEPARHGTSLKANTFSIRGLLRQQRR